MRRMMSLVLFLIITFGQVLAQQPAANEERATKEDVEKLFTTMHIREQMRNMMDIMNKQSKQMAHDALKNKIPNISQKELDRMDAMSDEILKDLDVDGMIDDMIPVYQRHLTRADVAAMAAFYETPTGQKMLREQPQMTAEAMQALQPRMQKMMSKVMDEAEKMAKEAAPDVKPADAPNK